MKSAEYRKQVSIMVRKALQRELPGIKRLVRDNIARTIAVSIHARMYGANVDGVESPLWREDDPPITAKDLLTDGTTLA